MHLPNSGHRDLLSLEIPLPTYLPLAIMFALLILHLWLWPPESKRMPDPDSLTLARIPGQSLSLCMWLHANAMIINYSIIKNYN